MYQLPKTKQFISKCLITNLPQNNAAILDFTATNSFSNSLTKINIISIQYFNSKYDTFRLQ